MLRPTSRRGRIPSLRPYDDRPERSPAMSSSIRARAAAPTVWVTCC